MCGTWLAENTGRKRSPKSAIWAPSHDFVGLYLCNEGTYRQSAKNVKRQYLLHMSPQYHNMVNFGPLAADLGPVVWGTPANFNVVRILAALLQRRRSPEVNQTLHNVWPSPGLLQYICIFGGSCPLAEFCSVQNSL